MLIKYSALVLTVALSAPSIAASSSNENDLGFEGYLLALGTMAPNRAKFTVIHKDFVENKCGSKLTITSVNSTGFQSIITALEAAERMTSTGLEKNTLLGVVMTSVMSNTSCKSFSSDFEALTNDKLITQGYPKFKKFITTWADINKDF